MFTYVTFFVDGQIDSHQVKMIESAAAIS